MDGERNRTAIHNWEQKADLQPTSDEAPNQIALDEPVIRINDERHWLYAAVDPKTNEFLHGRLFQTRTPQLTEPFCRALREKQRIEQATFLVDGAPHLKAPLTRLGVRCQGLAMEIGMSSNGVFREVKRRTSSKYVQHVEPPTAESRLRPSPSGGIEAKRNTRVDFIPTRR